MCVEAKVSNGILYQPAVIPREKVMRTLANPFAPWRRGWRLVAVILLCMVTMLVQAQSATDDDSADPPSRVARLSYMDGDLGFLPSGATDWSDASINRPLTTGDRLSTGQDARAELELGGGTLRIAGQTDFGLLDLNDQMAQVELTQGTLNLTVRHLEPGQSYEIDTPTIALVVDQPGTFRVDIEDDGRSTQVTAFDGGAIVYGENNAQRTVNPGRSYRFVDSSLAAVAISEIGGGDAFDAWCSDRDSRHAQSTTSQYVSDDVVGSQDLDQYGDWQDTGDYGEVWYPNQVAADWAPYRNGHWAYIAPWGWTWMDDSPWGFAPYHYGRWAYTHRGWGWIPGSRGRRSIYAPALVAFVGGGGWSAGIGGRPVGWFPLGPGEIYNPWYHCGRNYYTNVNSHNIRGRRGHGLDEDIGSHYERYRQGAPIHDGHYANRDAPRGFTAVPGNTFAGGRHVQHDLLHVDPRRLAAAPVLSRGTNLRPVQGDTATPRNAHARSLPVGDFHREVVARHAPPAPRVDGSNNLAGPRHAVTPRANVRVLNDSQSTNPSNVSRTSNQQVVGGDRRRPSDSQISPQRELPRTSNVSAGMPMGVHRGNSAAPDQIELPSARFAHPQADGMQGRDPHGSRESMSRPGSNYNSNVDDNRSRPASYGTRTLPQVPQIERATAINPPPAPEASERHMTAPRFERRDSNPGEQPRPMPEPARQAYQQPQYQQQQRTMPQYAPQPRTEAARPQHAESRPAERSAPRDREDRGH
jgi:hypothetical protein